MSKTQNKKIGEKIFYSFIQKNDVSFKKLEVIVSKIEKRKMIRTKDAGLNHL